MFARKSRLLLIGVLGFFVVFMYTIWPKSERIARIELQEAISKIKAFSLTNGHFPIDKSEFEKKNDPVYYTITGDVYTISVTYGPMDCNLLWYTSDVDSIQSKFLY